MPTYLPELKPVARRAIELRPTGEIKRVEDIEQVGEAGPIDILTEDDSSANSVSADGSTGAIEIAELETGENEIIQVRVDILSKMRLQLRQPLDESRRLNIAGGATELTMALPPQLREVFVNRNKVPQFVVQNPNKYPLQKALINASGFRLKLSSEDVSRGDLDADPVPVPFRNLDANTQGGGASRPATQSQMSGGVR